MGVPGELVSMATWMVLLENLISGVCAQKRFNVNSGDDRNDWLKRWVALLKQSVFSQERLFSAPPGCRIPFGPTLNQDTKADLPRYTINITIINEESNFNHHYAPRPWSKSGPGDFFFFFFFLSPPLSDRFRPKCNR